MVRLTLTALFAFLMIAAVNAQDHQQLTVPEGWSVRLDRPNPDVKIGADQESSDIWFVDMAPGWHITTGPAAIFWHPDRSASGTYRASLKIHLFDPKGRNEAFGLFIGGKNLDEANQQYTYFLLRNSGEYLIKQRSGDETEMVQNWTPASNMKQWTPDGDPSVANTLSIEVGADQTAFFINGDKVHSISGDEIDTEGVVGLRINHALNVHVEDLSVEEL